MISLDGNSLTLETFHEITHKGEKVSFDEKSRARVVKSRLVVEKAIQKGDRIYSINTGFGILSKVSISDKDLNELQDNIVRSHCACVGDPHPENEARGIVLLRANVLAKGYSGVRPEVVDLLVEMLNRGVTPVIPMKGSVGASGDLAPLAHLAVVLIGEGEAFFQGNRMTGGQALEKAGLKPLRLAPKEGLSLINGTQQMTSQGSTTLLRSEALVELADLISTATLEGILGSHRAYSDWVQKTRPFPGQMATARRLRSYMEDSEIYQSHLTCDRVQDPYSLRCVPQVHGSVRDLLFHVRNVLSIEMNSATDNPLVNGETGEIISGGNFHGQPIAFALDILGMAVAELASISERRIVKLLNPVFSELPTFLIRNEGLNSGFMIPQYTAASLVAENRILCHPGSTDSISTNNDKEDHVSMGPNCARKAKMILENTEYVLAIEALAACQALEFRKPLKPGKGPSYLYRAIREKVPALEKDRVLTPDIEAVALMIRSGSLYEGLLQEGLI